MGKCKASQEHAFPPQVREGVEGLENDYVSAEKLKEINGEIGPEWIRGAFIFTWRCGFCGNVRSVVPALSILMHSTTHREWGKLDLDICDSIETEEY